jgi:hypothetical protein
MGQSGAEATLKQLRAEIIAIEGAAINPRTANSFTANVAIRGLQCRLPLGPGSSNLRTGRRLK